jgi:hypothetical protein
LALLSPWHSRPRRSDLLRCYLWRLSGYREDPAFRGRAAPLIARGHYLDGMGTSGEHASWAIDRVASDPAGGKTPLLGSVKVHPYLGLGGLVPSASTFALMVGTGLLTFPLGLTEAMVIAFPEPLRPLLLLLSEPVWLLDVCTVRSTTFLGLGTCGSPYFGWVRFSGYCFTTRSAPNPRRKGPKFPTSPYSLNVVEGEFREVHIPDAGCERSESSARPENLPMSPRRPAILLR